MSWFIVFFGLGSQPPHCQGSGIILPSPAATQGVAGREGMLRQNLFIAQLPTGAMVRHPYWLPWLGTGQVVRLKEKRLRWYLSTIFQLGIMISIDITRVVTWNHEISLARLTSRML